MNYKTFSNLHFRPLFRNCSHSIHIDLKDTSGEKIPVGSLSITRLVLMFRKASSIYFWAEKRHKTVAWRQVGIPFYRGIGQQRGHVSVALAQSIGRTAISFLRKYIVSAAKRVDADLLEFSVPEIAEVVSFRKHFKIAAKRVGKQTLRKQLSSGSRKNVQTELFQQYLQNKPIDREETFYEYFSKIKSSNFRYQLYVAVSGNFGEKTQWLTMSCRPMNKK